MNAVTRFSGKWLGIPAWVWLVINLVTIAVIALLGPAEKSLGTHVRVVYLHGAWVWTSLVCFAAAAFSGLFGLLSSRKVFYSWSLAFGRAGLLFWITYIPLSIWAMQSNWNGLFLAEPRWRLALAFAVSGLLLQIGLAVLNRGAVTALGNIIYFALMVYKFGGVQNVMHPRAPIWESGHPGIQLFFASLLVTTLLLGWQTARLLRQGPEV